MRYEFHVDFYHLVSPRRDQSAEEISKTAANHGNNPARDSENKSAFYGILNECFCTSSLDIHNRSGQFVHESNLEQKGCQPISISSPELVLMVNRMG